MSHGLCVSRIGRVYLTLAVCSSHWPCVAHMGCVYLALAVCISHGPCVSRIGRVYFTLAMCISHWPCVFRIGHVYHIGSVYLTLAACISFGSNRVWSCFMWATTLWVEKELGQCVQSAWYSTAHCFDSHSAFVMHITEGTLKFEWTANEKSPLILELHHWQSNCFDLYNYIANVVMLRTSKKSCLSWFCCCWEYESLRNLNTMIC